MINSSFKKLFKTQIDTLFGSDSLSLPCKLVSADNKHAECSNCQIDPISGRSSGRYKVGGPFSFPYGQLCPICNGIGYIHSTHETSTRMLVIYDYKKWINFNQNLNSADGMLQTISKIEDNSKIQSANTLIVDSSGTYNYQNEYVKASDPQPVGFGSNDYVYTFWKLK